MNHDFFDAQIKRLRSQWPNGYGDERVGLLWRAFNRVPDEVFSEMIDLALATLRAAPLMDELTKLELEIKNRRLGNRVTTGLAMAGGMDTVLADIAGQNKNVSKDPDFVQACLQVLKDKQDGKLTMKQFLEGCDMLDQVARTLVRGG